MNLELMGTTALIKMALGEGYEIIIDGSEVSPYCVVIEPPSAGCASLRGEGYVSDDVDYLNRLDATIRVACMMAIRHEHPNDPAPRSPE